MNRRTENIQVFEDTMARLKAEPVYRELTQNAVNNTSLFILYKDFNDKR